MRWGGLEHLKVPQWRTAFEAADVIFGVDVATGQEILVFARGALENKLSDLLRAAQRGELVRPHKPERRDGRRHASQPRRSSRRDQVEADSSSNYER